MFSSLKSVFRQSKMASATTQKTAGGEDFGAAQNEFQVANVNTPSFTQPAVQQNAAGSVLHPPSCSSNGVAFEEHSSQQWAHGLHHHEQRGYQQLQHYQLHYGQGPLHNAQLMGAPVIIKNETRAVAHAEQGLLQHEMEGLSRKNTLLEACIEFWRSRLNRVFLLSTAGFIIIIAIEWWRHKLRMESMRKRIESSLVLRMQRLVNGLVTLW